LFFVFHELKLKGWPNYLSHIKGRHPMAVIEEAIHRRNNFPKLVAFTMGMSFPRSLTEDEPTAPLGAEAGARLPKHVSGSQQFPEITLKTPTKSHKKKYLNHITAQLLVQPVAMIALKTANTTRYSRPLTLPHYLPTLVAVVNLVLLLTLID
jgi:hypothetical protein